jgi:hypothetical protein
MEVRTPFAQVIVMAHEHRYSSMQAAEEYKKNPDTVQVRVQILNTATFAIASPMAAPQSPCHGMQRMNSVEDCFRTFRFAFGQGKDDLKPKSSYGVPIYSGGDNSSFLIGGNVWFVFRADDIHREDLFPGNL